MKVNESKGGLIVDIFVKPNCTRFGLKIDEEELTVCSTEEPTKGRVNREIVKELTKLLGHRVQIVSGLTSRQKKILVENYAKEDLEKFLSTL